LKENEDLDSDAEMGIDGDGKDDVDRQGLADEAVEMAKSFQPTGFTLSS
jgi:hypothetical protein